MNQLKLAVSSAQILFVAFKMIVLVLPLTGLSPSLALLGASIGTLLLQIVTKRKMPIFLGSSFAFITSIICSVETWGLPSTMFGLFAAGSIYFVFIAPIKWRGLAMVSRLLPPAVIGPVIIVIGLSVTVVTSEMTMDKSGGNQMVGYAGALILSGFTFAVTVVMSVSSSRMMKPVPILISVAVGYISALIMGLVDTATIMAVPWFTVPHSETPQIDWQATLFILPVAIAPTIEHTGGITAIGNVAGNNYTKDPGLDKTLAGDGLGVCVADLIGGPPVTTYGKVAGAVMITKNSNPVIMAWAAVFAIAMAFFGKFNIFLASTPLPVVDGVMLPLFGTIASLGIKMLVDAKVNLMRSKNLVIVSSVLVVGVGGMAVHVGTLSFAGVGLCAILAIVLNCLLPTPKTEIRSFSDPA